MSRFVAASALVVRYSDFSETSRIATLFTREFGKVRALAKGGRRLKSNFDSAFDLLSVCRVVCGSASHGKAAGNGGSGQRRPEVRGSKGAPMAKIGRPAHPWYRTKKDTWYVTVNGKSRSLGVRGRDKEAEAWAAFRRLTSGGFPADESLTVGQLIAAFLADYQTKAKSKTVKVCRWFLKPFADAHGAVVASTLSPVTVEAYSRKPTWGSSTRNGFVGTVVTALRWAVRAKMLRENPLVGVKKPPKTSRGRKALVDPADLKAVLDEASSEFATYLRVLHGTGARPGEVSALRAEHIVWDEGYAVLDEHKTAERTGRPRVIYFTPDVLDILREQAKKYPTGPILRNTKGRPWVVDSVEKAMKKTRERVGLNSITNQGCRHTFATDALSAGVPPAVVAELLGHKGVGMLEHHYGHLVAKTKLLSEAVRKVRGATPDIAAEPPATPPPPGSDRESPPPTCGASPMYQG
jgi:integrase/recombinase XerC